MIRAFAALRPPDDLCDRLEELALDLAGDGRPGEGRPTPWENLHLTLAFIGEVPGNVLEDIAGELADMRATAPELAFDGVGVFGGDRPRSVHARVRPSPELSALRDAVRRAVRRGGAELARERFTPHVTLARFGKGTPAGEGLARWLARNAGFASAPFVAGEAHLMRSELRRDGPVYTELMTIPLEPPTPLRPRATGLG